MTETLFKARKAFKIGGMDISAGDVVDLHALDLPPGRTQQLVNARYGTLLTSGSPTVPSPAAADPAPEPESVSVQPSEGEDPRRLTKAQLVALCEERGLDSSGNRGDLIDRLSEAEV